MRFWFCNLKKKSLKKIDVERVVKVIVLQIFIHRKVTKNIFCPILKFSTNVFTPVLIHFLLFLVPFFCHFSAISGLKLLKTKPCVVPIVIKAGLNMSYSLNKKNNKNIEKLLNLSNSEYN